MELTQLLPIEQLILKEGLILTMLVVVCFILCILFPKRIQFLNLALLTFLVGCLVIVVTLFIAI